MEFRCTYVINSPIARHNAEKRVTHRIDIVVEYTSILMFWSIAETQWKYHEKQCRAVTTRHYTHFKRFSITRLLPSPRHSRRLCAAAVAVAVANGDDDVPIVHARQVFYVRSQPFCQLSSSSSSSISLLVSLPLFVGCAHDNGAIHTICAFSITAHTEFAH